MTLTKFWTACSLVYSVKRQALLRARVHCPLSQTSKLHLSHHLISKLFSIISSSKRCWMQIFHEEKGKSDMEKLIRFLFRITRVLFACVLNVHGFLRACMRAHNRYLEVFIAFLSQGRVYMGGREGRRGG